jgi:glyoxylase I family protein
MSIDLRGITPLIQVFDMATSLKFYCDVLGFDIVQARLERCCSES